MSLHLWKNQREAGLAHAEPGLRWTPELAQAARGSRSMMIGKLHGQGWAGSSGG